MSKYGKYFVDVEHLKKIDIYRLVELFPINDHALEHVVKKLLLGGVRTGGKNAHDEVIECRDTLNRWLEMREEDLAGLPTAQPTLPREYRLGEVTGGVTLSYWAKWVAVSPNGDVCEYEHRPIPLSKWNSEGGSRYRRVNKVVPPINFKNCLLEVSE